MPLVRGTGDAKTRCHNRTDHGIGHSHLVVIAQASNTRAAHYLKRSRLPAPGDLGESRCRYPATRETLEIPRPYLSNHRLPTVHPQDPYKTLTNELEGAHQDGRAGAFEAPLPRARVRC